MSTPTKTSVADDAEIVRRILAHIDAGTTDQGDDWREPVENYVNPIRFTAELETLRSYPSVYLPSAAIPRVIRTCVAVIIGPADHQNLCRRGVLRRARNPSNDGWRRLQRGSTAIRPRLNR